jgi:hypothetical protein
MVRCAFSTLDSVCCVRVRIIGLRLLYGARFRQEFPRSRMPLVSTPLFLRLKRLHACGQWHFSRVWHSSYRWHCKFRPNTEGKQHWTTTFGTTSVRSKTLLAKPLLPLLLPAMPH